MSLQKKKALLTWNFRVVIIIIPGIVAAMILFTGCGQSATTNTAHLNAATPPLNTGGVTLHTDRTSYQQKDTISAILKNQSNQVIYFPDHLTDCSVVLLQRSKVQPLASDSGQVGVSPCPSKTVTRIHSLAPGQTLVVKLPAPSSGWAPGIYGVTLTYTTTFKQPKTIYTTAFTVGPFAPQP